MRFLAYIRVSTDGQVESGAGLEAQQDTCESYANQQGLSIHQIFRDEGISGASKLESRHGLLDLLQELKKGDVLLVAKRDRLSRDSHTMVLIEMAVKKAKARIISAAGEGTEGDANDPMSFMMRGMTDLFSQFERLLIRSRTKAALQAMKREGRRVGHVPFGYRVAEDGVHLEESPEEQDILRQMQELRSEGLSIRAIANELNNLGAFNRGAKWNHGSTHRILKKAA